ncbi:hypothetical protein BC827DRAFT_200228 [Russula dissimulans]|nr:hypothetical protein BC827DRAFT_200228 [Russula dissimulans]
MVWRANWPRRNPSIFLSIDITETVLSASGYPSYARPNDDREIVIRSIPTDNRWIVRILDTTRISMPNM